VVGAGAGDFDAQVYAFENTGENILITGEFGGHRIIAKGDRSLRKAIGETIGMKIDQSRIYVFDNDTGERIRFTTRASN
jgi:multiple sugar transport system ATP-binding protein